MGSKKKVVGKSAKPKRSVPPTKAKKKTLSSTTKAKAKTPTKKSPKKAFKKDKEKADAARKVFGVTPTSPEKNYKQLLIDASPEQVQSIVDEMVEKDIELEDVADEQADVAIYNKVAVYWKPSFAMQNGSSSDEGFQEDVDDDEHFDDQEDEKT